MRVGGCQARTRAEEHVFKAGPARFLQTAPFLEGDDDSRIDASPRHDLRPLSRVSSISSLKRALASCSCHLVISDSSGTVNYCWFELEETVKALRNHRTRERKVERR